MKKTIQLSLFFFVLTGVLFILSSQLLLEWPSMLLKCLIIPSLIVYFISSRGNAKFKEDKFIVIALVFSWLGDIILQIKNGGDLAFIVGLACFLCTHIFYTIVFFKTEGEFSFLHSKRSLILLIVIYGATTMYIILPGIGGMQLPVMVYGIVITGMAIAALSRFEKVNDRSYLLVFLGAILFILSDSLIAFKTFKQAFQFSGIYIMLTYLAAQVMIIQGLLKQHK